MSRIIHFLVITLVMAFALATNAEEERRKDRKAAIDSEIKMIHIRRAEEYSAAQKMILQARLMAKMMDSVKAAFKTINEKHPVITGCLVSSTLEDELTKCLQASVSTGIASAKAIQTLQIIRDNKEYAAAADSSGVSIKNIEELIERMVQLDEANALVRRSLTKQLANTSANEVVTEFQKMQAQSAERMAKFRCERGFVVISRKTDAWHLRYTNAITVGDLWYAHHAIQVLRGLYQKSEVMAQSCQLAIPQTLASRREETQRLSSEYNRIKPESMVRIGCQKLAQQNVTELQEPCRKNLTNTVFIQTLSQILRKTYGYKF